MKTALHDLADLGQTPWLDGHDLLTHGLADLTTQGIRGLARNPTHLPEKQNLLDVLRTTADAPLDTTADEALRALSGNPTLTTHLAIATAKIAYRTYKKVFTGMRWDELSGAGAHPQTCLWTSTTPTDPTLPTTKYIEALIGPDTITTMPHQTLEAFIDHGHVAPTLEDDTDPDAILSAFRHAGIDYDTLTSHLEKTGLRDSTYSFTEMLNELSAIRATL
ncbi:MAG: hypothetical protein HOW97_08220 [Catenulispora sp.]|nr:hypothetical protein [Catenulispora sp.]